ncbi:protein dopey-1 isoform X1 [Patella vulgata]|uniref:protein dopey-1 isoform X1 n=1 Tax=Patella vulgata TaxID=6465 RepID=UPI0021804EF7|nr:protein dopey-1 isoform X1 [Patella vulgata]XP_050391434.1 protein dopey-1 isoform X1 [Patella vulgata]
MSMLTVEECELLSDSKYRSYISQVDKALKSFEYTSEWADLISALGKLNKVLLSHIKYPVIPKKVTIGKRLAQCLHPALPGGVHLKALETYDIIFRCIGTQRLAQDLFVYSAGLFPLLNHAAMSVKPELFNIYEKHFVALGKHIKPGLNGLLIGLLPGLEEGAEYYDKANNLLESFCDAVDKEFFYTCMWECVLSCPSVRLPAITFLLSHFNKKKSMEDQLHMMGFNIDLMVQALSSSIQDTSVLVQRISLDFLLLGFPMHNGQLTKSDTAKIVQGAINVVLRRDMSLNRRLYGWLLGTSASGLSTSVADNNRRGRVDSTSTSSEMDLGYFHQFSKDLLVQAIKMKLANPEDNEMSVGGISNLMKPFRIIISLLDKPEIGPVIIDSVLMSVFRCLYKECKTINPEQKVKVKNKNLKRQDSTQEKNQSAELIKTANLLFGSFEPYFIWDYLGRMFSVACSNVQQRVELDNHDTVQVIELCEIGEFLLDIVSLEIYQETQTEHLPELLRHVISAVTTNCSALTEYEITATLKLCSKIFSKVEPSVTVMDFESQDPEVTSVCGEMFEDVFKMKKEQERKEGCHVEMDIAQSSEKGFNPAESSNKKIKELKSERFNNNGESTEKLLKSEPNEETNEQEEYKECKSSLDPEDRGETYFSAEDSPVKKPKVVKDGVKDVKSSENSESEQTQDPEVSKTDNMSQENKKRTLLKSISTDSRNHKNSVPLSIMQTCIHSFKELFHTLICDKILKGFTISGKCMEALITQTDNARSSDKDSVLDSNSTSGLEDFGSRDLSAIEKMKISPEGLSEASYEAFEKACRLLVDFASFPLFCTDFNKLMGQAMDDENEYSLPDWLQDLITCSCFIKTFEIQTAAISTILDLINLTQSVQTESEYKCQVSNRSRSMSEGRISVVILPALLPCHLKFMNENTLFFQVCASELWQHLGEKTSSRHRRSVELFHFLHQVSPSSWICEDTIGSSLVASDEKTRIESFKRFTIMWHLTRELKLDVKPGAGTRSFDRSMFVVLDSLKEESGATKTIATTWLTHCVQRGDISRVLQPILLMLLQPDTARISVQHVNIHQPRKVKISESGDADDIEAKIYAISSEGGNVIYHVSPDGKKFSQKATEELKSCAMAVTNDNGSAMTASVKSQTEPELSFERVNPEYLKLRFNPFGSEHSLDKLIYDDVHVHLPTRAPDLGNARRLDKTTCRKEGIFFDTEEANEALEGTEISSEEMVSQILEDLISKVVEQGEYSRLQNKRDSERTDSISRYSQLGDQDLLNAIDKRGMEMDSLSGSDTDLSKSAQESKDKDTTGIHTLHMHLLLYSQKYDYERTLYALSTLKAMLTMCPRLIVTALATTSISSMNPIQLTNLQLLLARHRKSVFGKNFFGEIQPEVLASYRSNMILEIFISLCLYYIRSYYPNLMVSKLSAEELAGNKDVHIMATEILTLLMSELISIVHESGKSFTSYITDLLTKCKLQKALLHCMLASVYNSRQKTDAENKAKITEAIVSFNEDCLEGSANETFQIKLLKLLLVMIMLESRMYTSNNEEITPASTAEWDRTKVTFQTSILNVHYSAVQPIVQQGMFLSGVLSALKQHHMSHLHRHWIAMVTSSLPYMGKALSRIVIAVVSQLCRNLEILSAEFESKKRTVRLTKVPPDHLLTMLEGLTAICHYCLLDNASPVSIGLPAPTITNISTETASTGQILSNLINVFNPIQNNRETSPIRDNTAMSPVLEARRGLLSILPRIMACMAVMWKALNSVTSGETDRYTQARLTMGSPKIVRQHILEFLSPISLPHGTNLLGAVAVAWNDRRKKIQGLVKKVVPVPCEDQLLLVELVSAIKVLPTDTLIQTIKHVLKQPPPTELTISKRGVTIEVNMLQFFYSYVEEISPYQLMDSWPSFLTLMKESLQLNLLAPGQFLLLEILSEFVQKMPTMEDKKQLKELQDITQKLLEAVAYIAGSSLQQTTWLRRNLAVKPGPQNEVQELEDGDVTEDSEPESDVEKRVVEKVVVEAHLNQAANSKYSVQALTLLAELTAPLLDVVYGSDEKDKISPFISTLLCNVFPYLKSHSCHNLPSFRASSQILSSISGYQYTRKSWRKEALEFLLDQGFFQMDLKCIRYWRSVIDNLMTHDKTTFKDLLSRVVMTPSGSLNLFSSKEQEYEQRAQMLKRLSFTIFCSDRDQYQRNMPDIQERLAESLKVPQVPSVQAQVFLCFRVLILRMTSHQLTSLWPTIITEMVHVCLQMEQELSTETDEFNVYMMTRSRTQLQRIAALDSSWAHLGNGLNAHNNPAWLQLYLSVCKLLDLCLALPADTVPQFQLYRWAFIGAAAGEDEDDSIKDKRILPPSFVPHIVRLSKLLNLRLQREPALLKRIPGRPLLTMTYLRSLVELQPFFNTLCHASQSEKNYQTPGGVVNTMPKSQSAPIFDELTASYVHDWQSDLPKSNRQFIEELVERDFLDLMS